MAKRGALNEMTHDNWDQEEEVEDAGVFRQASDAVIKQRPMKKAKRRVPQSLGQGDDGEGPKTAFKGFSGFVSSNKKPVFSLKQDSSKPLFGSFSNGRALAPFSLGVGANMASGAAKGETGTDKPGVAVNGSGFTPSRSKYLQQLRALNESVAKWITEHVNKNGHCVLTPIFKDYEKHLAEVEKLNPDKNQAGGESASEKPLVVDSKEGNDEKSSPAKEKSVKR